jgi:uridine kinase
MARKRTCRFLRRVRPMPAEQTYAQLAATVLRRPPRLGAGVRLVAVDGPSGAGKTSFAVRLGKWLDAPVVHTDDLLDGWDDQFTFWTRLEELVLGPLRRGETASYRRYRWELGEFAGPPVTVDPAPAVLLEGVSAARREIRSELSLAVFVEAPPDLRLARALARDGDDSLAFRAYLERWRAAEDRHFAEDQTAAAADVVVDGAAEAGNDRFAMLSTAACSEDGVGR